jgi:hypothetical protein
MVSENFVITEPESAGIISAVNTLARRFDAHASAFSTRRDDVLQTYEEGVTASDPNLRMNNLQKAFELDPTFGLAYLSAIEVAAQASPAAASDILQRASAHKDQFTALDRARLEVLAARFAHAPLADQIAASARLERLTPNGLDAIVGLASLRFLQGDSSAGKQLMQKALLLSPGNASVRALFAQGLVEAREFRAAEGVFQSLEANPATVPQLALCVFLEGDTTRAASIFARYLNSSRAAAKRHCHWFMRTGSRLPAGSRKPCPFYRPRSYLPEISALWP